MSTDDDSHDPSVGVRRRHLPNFVGEETTHPEPMTPPSAIMHWPQTKAPALEARKTATPPMSSGWPMRLRADLFSSPARISGLSHSARAKSVWMRPGAMALMRILCLPHSMASDFTSDRSAALLML